MSDSIDIKGIDKGELLAALHNGTRPLGMGFMHDLGRDMTPEEGRKEFAEWPEWRPGEKSFDYFHGRPLKVTFAGDELMHTRLYDRDAGGVTAQSIVDRLRKAQAAA